MGNTIINVTCEDQRLTIVTQPIITSGGINVDVVKFTFDSLWTDYTKTAVFYRDTDHVYHVPLNASDEATIPQEVLADEGFVYIGVFGILSGVTRTSEVVGYYVRVGAITTGIPAPTPTPTVYERILNELAQTAHTRERKLFYNALMAAKGTTWNDDTDTATQTTHNVPADAMRYAEIIQWGGKTVVTDGEYVSVCTKYVASYDDDDVIQRVEIPSEILNLDGYGKSAGAAYNYIDWRNRVYHKRVGILDLGSLNWELNSGCMRAFTNLVKGSGANNVAGNLLCNVYATNTLNNVHNHLVDNAVAVVAAGTFIEIYDSDYSDPATFKTAVTGTMLYYEMTTETTVDVSQFISDDNLVAVVPSGSIVFENEDEDGEEIPTTINYMVKL